MARQFGTPILLPADPTQSAEATNKNYVDTGLSGKAATSHTHSQAQVTSLTGDLANKANVTHTHTEADVTGLAGDLDAKAPLESPFFTGIATFEATVNAPVTLVDAATILVDATEGNLFRVTLGGNRTMGVPSTPSDGQQILFEITQDATGGRVITWTSGAGGFIFDIAAPVLSTVPGAKDFVTFVYNVAANRWRFAPVRGGVTELAPADASILIAGTASTPTIAVGEIDQDQVIDLDEDLSLKAPLASPTFSGLATFVSTVSTPVVLTDAATIVVDAALGNVQRVTLGGNRTMGVPANPVDGQDIVFELIQDGTGGRTVTWTSGAGGFQFDTVTPVLATAADKHNFVTFRYCLTTQRWHYAPFPTPTASDVGAQPLDSDLTAFAALAPADGTFVKRAAGAWTAGGLPLVASTPYTVTYAGSITIDPTLGSNVQITATGNPTIGISTTGVLNGQLILLEVLAQTTQRTVTLTGINITTGLAAVNPITTAKIGFFGFRYSSLDSLWHLMSYGAST